MTKIKLCGLTRPEDIEVANRLKPDYIGFVMWNKSSRFVLRQQAACLKKALLPGIKAVGVFVDEDPQVVASFLEEGIIDIAQLHGSEDGEYIRTLKRLSPGSEIIKAIRIEPESSLGDLLQAFEGCEPEYYLFDSGTGSGQRFNWDKIKGAEIGRPFFLAGGLDPDNVAGAIEEVSPYAVDVSSGIETDKKKDEAKMERFVAAARSAL
jgi:phosphoribosylanthranilate isomerase